MPQHPTSRLREQPIEKAARLLGEGRVSLSPSARVYDVEGDTATYQVVTGPAGTFCPCPASTSLCSHVLAVIMVAQPDPGEQAELFTRDPFAVFDRAAARDAMGAL